jgi:hypothetical protein
LLVFLALYCNCDLAIEAWESRGSWGEMRVQEYYCRREEEEERRREEEKRRREEEKRRREEGGETLLYKTVGAVGSCNCEESGYKRDARGDVYTRRERRGGRPCPVYLFDQLLIDDWLLTIDDALDFIY